MNPTDERKVAAWDALMEACQRGGLVSGRTAEGEITEHLLDKVVENACHRAALAAAEEERDAATEGMSLLVLAEYCTEQSVRAHDDGDWKYWRDQRGRVCELAKKIPVVRAMMDKYLEGTGENARDALAKEGA